MTDTRATRMPPAPQSPTPQSKPPEQFELAQAPFDDPRADLILRSSDEVPVHFRVFKNILSLASPIFGDMFTLPSPRVSSKNLQDEVQMVTLTEQSTTLDTALRHIYPVRRAPKVDDTLQCASILAEFSRKYQIEALYHSIIGYLKDGIEDDPVGVYAIAVTYGYDDIGADAARLCLKFRLPDLQSSYLRCATSEHISELFKYHATCGQAASSIASSDRSWFSSLPIAPQRAGDCRLCLVPDFVNQLSAKRRSGPLCLWTYFLRSALVLAHHPTPEAVTKEDFVLRTNDCSTCAPFVRAYMIELSVVFGREIKKAILQVPLPKAVSTMRPASTTTSTNSGVDSYLNN